MPTGPSESYREMLAGAVVKLDRVIDDLQRADDKAEASEKSRRKTEELIWIELRNIKHDRANKDMIQIRDTELADRRTGEIERRLGRVEEITTETARILKQYTDLKGKVVWLAGGLRIILVAILIGVWEVTKPLYEGWAHWFWGPPPGGH